MASEDAQRRKRNPGISIMTTIKSPKKLTGFAPYLSVEHHRNTGKVRGKLVDEYVYEIPEAMVGKAVGLGGVVMGNASTMRHVINVCGPGRSPTLGVVLDGGFTATQLREIAYQIDKKAGEMEATND